MLELTTNDTDNVTELAAAVVRITENLGVGSGMAAALVPIIAQELRAAHTSNKQQRVFEEQQEIAERAGLNRGMGVPASPGYYGQKL